jgi:hypothetical protein
MHPGRTHAGGTRDLPDRQPCLLGRHDGPDPFPLGICQPGHSEAEPDEELLFATDTLVQGFRGFHAWKDTCFSLNGTEN